MSPGELCLKSLKVHGLTVSPVIPTGLQPGDPQSLKVKEPFQRFLQVQTQLIIIKLSVRSEVETVKNGFTNLYLPKITGLKPGVNETWELSGF